MKFKFKHFFKKLLCIFNCCNSSCLNKKEQILEIDFEDFKHIIRTTTL
jgi:hypothetical protein